MIDEITENWEWLSFLARYCAGKNIAKAFCDDVKWWALGVGALVIVLVVWWIFGRLARAYGNWSHRRQSARIADGDTMKKHVWAGHDAHLTSSDQRANRKSGK